MEGPSAWRVEKLYLMGGDSKPARDVLQLHNQMLNRLTSETSIYVSTTWLGQRTLTQLVQGQMF